MRALLAGSSGFLGTAVIERLRSEGVTTRRLVRREPSGADELRWDPYAGSLPGEALAGVDVVVNLAGAPIAHWPWTSSYRETLLQSRLQTTRTLVEAIGRSESSPALVNASAVGAYGKDRGDESLTEVSERGDGFLADLVHAWESEAQAAEQHGSRVALVRTAVVLDASGGALRLMRIPFLLGVGGRLGDGSQWFSTISRHDYCEAVVRLATDPALSGVFNLSAPEPGTNADLTRLLGAILHRPTIMPVPAVALRTLLGELSAELLGSLRVLPARLTEAGFAFTHPTLESQLRSALAPSSQPEGSAPD